MSSFKFNSRFKKNRVFGGGKCQIEMSYASGNAGVGASDGAATPVDIAVERKTFKFHQEISGTDMDEQQCKQLFEQAVEEQRREWNVDAGKLN